MKKIFSLSVLLFCGLLNAVEFNPTSFATQSLLYGNKTANLIELKNVIQKLNQDVPTTKYEVPNFVGISNQEIQAHLEKHDAFEKQQTLWKKFQSQQDPSQSTITPEAATTLEAIQELIRATFSENKKTIFESTSLKTFLNKAKSTNTLLMVRSTGKEDSQQNVNAGGNESIAAVKPEPAAITKAMGDVIASYFSQRSITQRLMVKDQSLLDSNETPFMPVLIQVMIGEPIGGSKNVKEIPTSGVMFSQEAEGNTPGITHIQATFGHNEGVVNGTVPFDTFYIDENFTVYPLIQIKINRLIPTKNSALKSTQNPLNLQKAPCLSPEQLTALKKCADAIHNHYKSPNGMDIEFVVQNGVVCIVQARPVAHKKISPAYLKKEFVQQISPADKRSIIVISGGGGKTQIIDNPVSLIVAETIQEAYDTFLYKNHDKDAIKSVILGQMAPSMSHEINMLRGAGKQVIYTDNLAAVKTWLAEVTTAPIIIDTQRELIVHFVPTEQFTSPKDILATGWANHPIAKHLSLFSQFIRQLTPEQMSDLKPENKNPEASLTALLENIQAEDVSVVRDALKTILFRLVQTVASATHKSVRQERFPELVPQLKLLLKATIACSLDVLQAAGDNEEIKKIYPINFLQAIIKQLPSPLFVHDYSFGALLKIEKQEERLAGALELSGPNAERIVQYAKATEYALTAEVQNSWQIFLKSLNTVTDASLQDSFAQLIYNVAQMDIMPLWLNTSFVKEIQKSSDAQTVATNLVQKFETAKTFFDVLQKKKTSLTTFTLKAWEDPLKFKKQWHYFNTEFVSYFASQEFVTAYQKASDLGKLGALSLMQQFVSVFDSSIKTLEASRAAYAGKETKLVENFRTMLNGYSNTLEQWATLLEYDSKLVENLLYNKPGKTLAEHFTEIKKLIDQTPTTIDQLIASRLFNVAASALGSQANWMINISGIGRSFETTTPTLEDWFSLIHQNLLVVLNALSKQTSITTLPTPPIVRKLNSKLEKIVATGDADINLFKKARTSLIGINFDGTMLTYFYNMPLRSHSNTFQVIYDLKNKKAGLLVQFWGGNEQNRWDIVALGASMITNLFGLEMEKAPEVDVQRGIVSFGWYTQTEDQATIAVDYLEKTIQAGGEIRFEGIATLTNDRKKSLEALLDLIIKRISDNPIFFITIIIPELEKWATDNGLTIDDTRITEIFRLFKNAISHAQGAEIIKLIRAANVLSTIKIKTVTPQDAADEKKFEELLDLVIKEIANNSNDRSDLLQALAPLAHVYGKTLEDLLDLIIKRIPNNSTLLITTIPALEEWIGTKRLAVDNIRVTEIFRSLKDTLSHVQGPKATYLFDALLNFINKTSDKYSFNPRGQEPTLQAFQCHQALLNTIITAITNRIALNNYNDEILSTKSTDGPGRISDLLESALKNLNGIKNFYEMHRKNFTVSAPSAVLDIICHWLDEKWNNLDSATQNNLFKGYSGGIVSLFLWLSEDFLNTHPEDVKKLGTLLEKIGSTPGTKQENAKELLRELTEKYHYELKTLKEEDVEVKQRCNLSL